MEVLNYDDIIKRTDIIENLLLEKLNLKNNLTDVEIANFYSSIVSYLKHSKNGKTTGRTPETFEKNLDDFLEFAHIINLSEIEIINTISKLNSIIHMIDEKFYWKYILMSVVENKENTLRKTNFVSRTWDFNIDLELLYARYCLMKQLNYPEITWNSLVKNSEKDFAKIFVKGKYFKHYKVFQDIEDVSSDKLRSMFSVDYNFLYELAQLPINQNFYFKGEQLDEQGRTK